MKHRTIRVQSSKGWYWHRLLNWPIADAPFSIRFDVYSFDSLVYDLLVFGFLVHTI